MDALHILLNDLEEPFEVFDDDALAIAQIKKKIGDIIWDEFLRYPPMTPLTTKELRDIITEKWKGINKNGKHNEFIGITIKEMWQKFGMIIPVTNLPEGTWVLNPDPKWHEK